MSAVPRIVIVCPAVRGVMTYHLKTIANYYPESMEITLFVPEAFKGENLACALVKYRIPRSNLGKLAAYFSVLWARRRFDEIKRLNPDIVHLFNGEGYPSSWLWARWTTRELKKPFIVTIHDPEPHPGSLVATLTHLIGRKTWTMASHVAIFSECFAPIMHKFGIGGERLFIVPLCIDVSIFLKYASQGISREPVALFFGRIQGYKGIHLLVEAAEKLRGTLRIIIAGPGKLPLGLKKRILSQPDLFELHNRFLMEAEVARLFQRASVCVMPYVHATQSTVPLIAAAFGVPVVATAIGGLASQVQQMQGILVPPNDPQALAEGILRACGRRVRNPESWNPKIAMKSYQIMYYQIYDDSANKSPLRKFHEKPIKK